MLNAILSGNMIEIVLTAFSLLVMLLIIFPLHESAHALVAKWLGDDTAERQGRITLNPLPHLDIMGTIGILLFGIGWAKPVPVNTNRCHKVKSRKTAMALTAAAGPLANLLSALLFMVIMKIIEVSTGNYLTSMSGAMIIASSSGEVSVVTYIIEALYLIINIDLLNGVFNLLPIPPFDGSRVVWAFLPERLYFSIMRYEQIIMFVLLGLMLTGIISIPFRILSNAIYSFFNLITGFIC